MQDAQAIATPSGQPPSELPAREHWRLDGYDFASAGVVGAVVLLSFLVAWLTGSIHLPQNDDWSFIKSALLLHRTGHLHLQGWGQMFLIGQLLAAQPFLWVLGPHVAALQAFGLVTLAIWLVASFLLAKRLTRRGGSLLVVVTLAGFPALGVLGASFMTDLPSAAAAMLCLLLGAFAVERRSLGWLIASVLVGLWGFTVREQMVIAPVAVLVSVLANQRATPRLRLGALATATQALIVCALVERWRHGLPFSDAPPFSLGTLDLHRVPPSLPRLLFATGLALAPACVWRALSMTGSSFRSVGRLAGWTVGIAALIWVRVALPLPQFQVTGGNYFTRTGAFAESQVAYQSTPVFSATTFTFLEIIAALTGVLLCGELGHALGSTRRWWRRARAEAATCSVTLFTAASVAILVVLAFAGQRQVDRYVVVALPGLACLLIADWSPERGTIRPALRLGSFGLLAVLLSLASWRLTASADVRDVARWSAAERLVHAGVPATAINAGLEWNGLHASTPAYKHPPRRLQRPHRPPRSAMTIWIQLFPRSTNCYVVRATPYTRPQWLLLTEQSRPGNAFVAPVHMYSYFFVGPACRSFADQAALTR